jgi:hypothetical protein
MLHHIALWFGGPCYTTLPYGLVVLVTPQVRIWDYTKSGAKMVLSFGSHTKSVLCCKWGGSGLLYTASQDRNIFVWNANTGQLVRQLSGHAHWVNSLSLSTDYVMRTGPFNHRGVVAGEGDDMRAIAKAKYDEAVAGAPELLVSGSEDNTMYLWNGAAIAFWDLRFLNMNLLFWCSNQIKSDQISAIAGWIAHYHTTHCVCLMPANV